MDQTIYWHDYETFGVNPSVDRPSQFAGVRTNTDFEVIGEPLMVYCRPISDCLPSPDACLVTGITPQYADEHGLSEPEFISRIHEEFSQPQTCVAGYNSLRFDDEVTRYTLYRNFYDPYAREWQNGNSRWDIIDMVRLVYALRPEGIEWPMLDGLPSFRLEHLSAANNLSHGQAHDAYSDVEATIELARLIKQKQPALYNYVVENKAKAKVASMIDIQQRKPLFHISAMFGSARGCSAFIAPLAMHPKNKNSVIAFDLSCDPSALATLKVEEIQERIFTKSEDLPEGVERLAIKEVHLNKSPILATTKLCDDKSARRLNIDRAACEKHWRILCRMNIDEKIKTVFASQEFEPRVDPEQKLYEGFLNNSDKQLMSELRDASLESLKNRIFLFNDSRLNEMVLRYKARNFPGSLDDDERGQWKDFVNDRLENGDHNILSRQAFVDEVSTLLDDDGRKTKDIRILNALLEYARSKTES